MKRLWTILMLLILSFPVYGDITWPLAGDALLQYCNAANNGDTYSNGYCYGYIQGAFDAYIYDLGNKVATLPNCYTTSLGGVYSDQLIRIVFKYLTDTPALLNQPAPYLIETVLTQDFPIPDNCKPE